MKKGLFYLLVAAAIFAAAFCSKHQRQGAVRTDDVAMRKPAQQRTTTNQAAEKPQAVTLTVSGLNLSFKK